MTAADPSSDHALMLAVRGGRIDALGDLFERHHGALYGFLYRLAGDRSSAEDICQNVFHRMLKYRHTYRDDGSFTAWMYHLARRCAADHFRKQSRGGSPTDPATIDRQIDPSTGAADDAASKDDQKLLEAALQSLEPSEREVLLLSRLQELSFAEIAGILECSAGAARVRAHRALHALRARFFTLQQKAWS